MAGKYACGSQALYLRLWRAHHKAHGLCSHCNRKALAGLRTCFDHKRDVRTERAAERRKAAA